LCTMIKQSEDRSVVEVSEQEQVNKQYRHLANGWNLVLAHTDVLLSRSDKHVRMCSHTLPTTFHYSTDGPHQEEPVINLPPPPIDDTLSGSMQQRKRRRAIEQDIDIASESRSSNIPRPILSGVDNNHKIFHAFIEDYILKWRPNEVKYGQEWRVDKPIIVQLADGTTTVKKPNTRAAWYNVQQPMYEFLEVSFVEGLATGLSIEDTIEQGKQIYCSAIKSDKQEQPAMQDVKRKFVTALQNKGI
jgi:hypothetical protein